MRMRKLKGIALIVLTVIPATSLSFEVKVSKYTHMPARYRGLPEGATRCDPSLPIFLELNPLNEPAIGRLARFEVNAESTIDPDLVERSWVEYEVPPRMGRIADAENRRAILGRSGRGRTELDLLVPDEARYEIRARLIVRLATGQTFSQTAVRWIDLGNNPPEGMLGRIAGPDGAAVRVYRGMTVRDLR